MPRLAKRSAQSARKRRVNETIDVEAPVWFVYRIKYFRFSATPLPISWIACDQHDITHCLKLIKDITIWLEYLIIHNCVKPVSKWFKRVLCNDRKQLYSHVNSPEWTLRSGICRSFVWDLFLRHTNTTMCTKHRYTALQWRNYSYITSVSQPFSFIIKGLTHKICLKNETDAGFHVCIHAAIPDSILWEKCTKFLNHA